MPADLRDAGQRERVERRLAHGGDDAVDLLVNNAGLGAYDRFAEIERDTQQAQIDVNVTAVMRLAHTAVPAMLARGRGAVLNVSSLAAFQPQPYGAVYAATKAFVNSLTHALHEETRGTGVSVTALCPGFIRTEFQHVAGVEGVSLPKPLWASPAWVVRAGLDGAARGRSVVVPGWSFRAAALAASLTPARVTRRILGPQTASRLPSR